MENLSLQQRANMYKSDEMIVELKGSKAIVHGDVGGKVKYSTDEQVVGAWLDGSAVYQKTYIVDNPQHNTWAFIPLNTNIDTILNIEGMAKCISGSEVNWYGCYGMNTSIVNERILLVVNPTTGNLEYNVNSLCEKLIVTLKYTKPTIL